MAPSRRSNRIPTLRHHKASGQGFVELNGKRHYLGVFGLPETKERYARTLAEWLAHGRRPLADRAKPLMKKPVGVQ